MKLYYRSSKKRYNKRHLIYSAAMYDLIIIAVESTAIHTFLYFNVSEVPWRYVEDISPIPQPLPVCWTYCRSWDNSCIWNEIRCYKTTLKDREETCIPVMTCGIYQEYDNKENETCENDGHVFCCREAVSDQTMSMKTKYKATCDVMTGGIYTYFPIEYRSSEEYTSGELNFHYYCSTDRREIMSETWLNYRQCYTISNCCVEHPCHQINCFGDGCIVNELTGDRSTQGDTNVPVGIICWFYSMKDLVRKLTFFKESDCQHETRRNQETGHSSKIMENMKQTCAKVCHCCEKSDFHNAKSQDGDYCRSDNRSSYTKMKLIDNVNIFCVMLFLCFIFWEIRKEPAGKLKQHCVKQCYNTVKMTSCKSFRLYETFKKKWNHEAISKHKEMLTWLPASKLFCLETYTSNACESVRSSDISNYLCTFESHINKVKEDIMSVLCELHADFIRIPQVTAYPLMTTLNRYLTRVQNEGSVPLDEEMCYEVRRLQSYSAVPVRTSPMRLAKSGFYATGSGDETRCYSCRMTHSGWKLMDQPDQIHRSVSPECQHLNRRDQRNVPIAPSGSEDATSVCSVMESYPVTTVSSELFPSGASPSAPLTRTPALTTTTPKATTTSPMTTTTTTAASTTSGSSDLPGLDISKAVYPQYRDLSRRLDSYQGWGCSHVQDHQVLAKAGFYYAGYRDCVRCFYCGVGLRTWEREDDPWVEHVRWRSSCDYVRLMRGEQFVIQALANGLSVAMASSQQSECSQLQSSQQSMSGYGTGAVSKAEEMGFQRDHIERAVVELTGTHSTTRDNIPLETLLEKLVIMSEQPVTTTPTTYSSIPAVHSSSSAFSTPQSQPISVTVTTLYGSKGSSPEGSRKEMTSSSRNSHTGTAVNVTSSVNMAESQTGAPFTVTSTEQLAPNNSISSGLSSVTNQKAVESSHTKGGSREPAVLSASQERQLEEENQSLRDEGTCKICLDNPSCIVFLPCGHLVTCAECAPALRKCPICRALIRGSVRAHTVSSEDVNI